MFLYGETREVMMHVAGLMPFAPPPDWPPEQMRFLMDEIREGVKVEKPWNVRLRSPDMLRSPLQAWVDDDEVDVDYHVRRSALPRPGDERELGILVSRLHANSLDFHRPPWEVHLIEGLEGGRFAMYAKVHHALVDGYTSMRILANALTTDPDDRTRPLFFAIPPRVKEKEKKDNAEPASEDGGVHFTELLAAVRAQYGTGKTVVKALMNVISGDRNKELVSPLQAPKCVLNARITRNRRFATQKVATARVKAVANAIAGTVNDVVLGLCSSALRRYLAELEHLPDKPLVAMLPVAIRAKGDAGGGNAVGAILASLATDVEDPQKRLETIVESTKQAKAQLQGMSPAAVLSYSAMLVAPAMMQMLPITSGKVRPTFNVVISNVPGPDEHLYFRGARLEGSFPVSIPVHGQALNITCSSYAGSVCFGFTGCRDTVPHLQRIAVYCGEALDEYERALGLDGL
jgi:diacylglycerol O-acyltransferase / wax synthase